MTEQKMSPENSRLLVEVFLESKTPTEVDSLFSGLEIELKKRHIPIIALIPMMSLQGEWAIKRLTGVEPGYGDIDWGVVIDCPPNRKEDLLRQITQIGNKYFEDHHQKPCTEITPLHYSLNIAELDTFISLLPEASEKYIKGERESFQIITNASLPFLASNHDLSSKYTQRLKSQLSESDFIKVQSALRMFVDWSRSVKKGKTIVRENELDSLNRLRRLPYENEGSIKTENMKQRSFGVIAVKPGGMYEDVPEIIDYVLSLNKRGTNLRRDEVVNSILKGMTPEEQDFFIDGLTQVNLLISKYGDYTGPDSFWTSSYKSRLGNKFWYRDLIEVVNHGTTHAFIIDGNMTQEDMRRWLDLFKGKENIVRINKAGEIETIKQGKGIRGMYDSEAVIITKDRILKAIKGSVDLSNDEIEKINDKGMLFTEIPDRIAPLVWEQLNDEEKKHMLGNFVHMSGEMNEVLSGSMALLQPRLGDSIINRLMSGNLPPEMAMETLVDIYTLINDAEKRQLFKKDSYPEDSSSEKNKFSYTMLVVKPTGMTGDFPGLIEYLFDPTTRHDQYFNEIAGYIERTFDKKYRKTFRRILDSTLLDATFFGSYKPGVAPFFWEANYLRKNGGRFYYKALLNGFRGGQNVEIFLLRSSVPQHELDMWIKKVKGREMLKHTVQPSGTEKTMFKGYGIRGLLDVEVVLVTKEKKQQLINNLDDPKVRVEIEEKMRNIKLPINFSRLPDDVQSRLWDMLSQAEQQSIISNFIHSPDDLQTTYDGVLALARIELEPSKIEHIIKINGGRVNVIIFDIVTEILKRRLNKLSFNKTEEDAILLSKHASNTRFVFGTLSKRA